MAILHPVKLLERLVCEPESTWLEFKTNNNDPEMIGRTIAALANAAILADRERAFLVFGISNDRQKVGTSVTLRDLKKGGENFQNWLSRMLEPRLMVEFSDFNIDEKKFAIIAVAPTFERPVKFSGNAYIRIGENTRALSDFPDHERSIWLATGRRKFEHSVAMFAQSFEQVKNLLDIEAFYTIANEPMPRSDPEILRRLIQGNFVTDNLEGGYNVTNLGAILLAKDLASFSTVSKKSVRIIKYSGSDKRSSEFEEEINRGYALGFSGMMKLITARISEREKFDDGVRKRVSMYPEIAIREIVANALIHQDFTIGGAGPIIEIFSNRIEVINPGNSLIDPDRMLDERRSRNESLASTMRSFGICEERGGGLDKTVIELEKINLPAPEIIASENSMRVILSGPKEFSNYTKQEKLRACFFHCVLRWIARDYMSNSSLRERFKLGDEDYQAVSAIITESSRAGRIAPADPKQGKRNARYIPYFAA